MVGWVGGWVGGVDGGSCCVPVQPPAEVTGSQKRSVTVALDVRGGAQQGSGVYLRAPNFTFTRFTVAVWRFDVSPPPSVCFSMLASHRRT